MFTIVKYAADEAVKYHWESDPKKGKVHISYSAHDTYVGRECKIKQCYEDRAIVDIDCRRMNTANPSGYYGVCAVDESSLTENKEITKTKKKLRDIVIQLNGDINYQFENYAVEVLNSEIDLSDCYSTSELLASAGLACMLLKQQEEIKQLQIEIIALKQSLKRD